MNETQKVVRFVLAVGVALLGASATLAGTYVWQGGETTTGNWNESANWEPNGVPGAGDTATIGSAVTFTSGITIGEGQLVINNTAAVTVSGVITGAGGLRKDSSGELTLSGANDFTGAVILNGTVRLSSATALGVQSAPIDLRNGDIRFACPNATYAYDIQPYAKNTYILCADANTTLDGSIENDALDYFYIDLQTKKNLANTTFTVNGRVAVRDNNGGWMRIRPGASSSVVKVLGGIRICEVSGDATGDGYSVGWRHYGGDCQVKRYSLAYQYGFKCQSSTVLSEDTQLYFCTYTSSDKGCVDLNGFSQTANRLDSSTATPGFANCWRIYTAPESPATLTLKPSKSALTNAAYLEGATSLVLDAPDPETVQIFQTRTSTTTGDLTVSNGILRIASGAAFPNVTKLAICDGGRAEILTAASAAFAGLTELSVEAGGTLLVDSAAASAFGTKAVALSHSSSATITLGADVTLTVASLTIDGQAKPSGSYPYGEGTVVVPTPVSPTATGVWTGGGDTTSSLDQKNWEGGYPGAIDVTFATGGTQAALAEDLQVKSVTFTLPAEATSFEVTSNETSSAGLDVAENVSMTAGSVPQTARIGVPLTLDSATTTLSVEGADNTLVLDGPIIPGSSSFNRLVKNGAGALYLNAASPAVTAGKLQFLYGSLYLKGGAWGGTPSAKTTLEIQPSDKAASFYFNGGVFNQTCTFITGVNGAAFSVAAGTTNVINGKLTVQHTNYNYLECLADSSTTLNGGYGVNFTQQLSPVTRLHERAGLIVNGAYTVAKTQHSPRGYIASVTDGCRPEEQRVVFGGTGSKAPCGLVLVGPMHVTFTADFVFANDVDADMTPLYLLRAKNTAEYLATVVDLDGHSQGFGSLVMRPKGQQQSTYMRESLGDNEKAYFTSATPATLYVKQNGQPNTLGYVPTFRGAVSLVKSGTNTLTLARASSSSGRLEVREGRLDFEGEGAWTNVSEVAVSGGVLAISDRGQLKKNADYYLSAGKLDIAAGVTLKAANLYVPDGADGWTKLGGGLYTRANLPDCISGDGGLWVRGGMVMFLK